MWRETGLLGRDKELKVVREKMLRKKGYSLIGNHGLGKTAIMEWAYKHTQGKKAYVSATWTKKLVMQTICKEWDLEVKNSKDEVVPYNKALVPWMEESILSAESGWWLFVDDLHRAPVSLIQMLKPLRDRCQLVCTIIPPIRKEEMKRLLWGITQIQIKPLPRAEMMRIGSEAARLLGSSTPVTEAVHAARGRPAHLLHALKGEVTLDNEKNKDEEIDLAPALLIIFGGIMVFRAVSRTLDSTALTLLSGCGMGALMVGRYFIFKGIRK